MGQVKNNPDPVAAKAARQQMKALREALGMSQATFAAKLGLTPGTINNREKAVADWRPEEITAAKARISKHLTDATLALDALES